MARLFWLLLMLAAVAAVVGGASWAMAYTSVGTLLGAPPPQMGTQSTRWIWRGLTHQERPPFEWIFVFGPTAIPGATRVVLHIGPTGKVLRIEPADLQARLVAFHRSPY